MKLLIGDYKRSLEGGQSYQETLLNFVNEENLFIGVVTRDATLKDDKRFQALQDKIHVIPLRTQPVKLIGAFKKLRRQGYEAIYLNRPVMSVTELLACRVSGLKVIMHAHSSRAEAKTKRRRMILSADHYLARFLIFPLLSKIRLACSESASAWFYGKSALKKKKAIVINNAIEVEKYLYSSFSREKERQDLGLDGKFVVGHIGRFVWVKNQSFLIDVFHELLAMNPQAVLLIVGNGEKKGELLSKAKTLGIADKVTVLEPRVDVNVLYSVFDAFVLPSFFEGLPLTLVEAQAASLPCFVSDTVSKDCAITNQVQFLPLQAGPKVWAESIANYVYEDRRDRSAEIKEAGFDIRDQIKKVEEIILKQDWK